MGKRLTESEFFDIICKKYNGVFDFSNTEFNGCENVVKFKCVKCGNELELLPKRLLYEEYKCKECYTYKKKDWLKICKEIHGDEYDYSLSNYERANKKVEIIHKRCGTHFFMTPNNHTNRHSPQGCPKCNGKKKKTTKEFISESERIFGKGAIIYSKTNYVNAHTELIMTCPIHGDFFITPNKHLSRKVGCQKCSKEKNAASGRISEQIFYERCKSKFGNKFTYVNGNYNGMDKSFTFICKKHGEQEKIASAHLNSKCGCNLCANEKLTTPKTTISELKEMVFRKYGDLYTFKTQDFTKMRCLMKFTCKVHGDFYETPTNLLRGCKCKKCQIKYSLEDEIKEFLEKIGEEYISQYRNNWLDKLSLDFYLPKYNRAIECQGRQHYELVNSFGGKEAYKKQLERDGRKLSKCLENGVKLLYFTHYNFKSKVPSYTFISVDELFNYINTFNHGTIIEKHT